MINMWENFPYEGEKMQKFKFWWIYGLKSESWYQIISSQSLAHLRNTEKDRIWKNSKNINSKDKYRQDYGKIVGCAK